MRMLRCVLGRNSSEGCASYFCLSVHVKCVYESVEITVTGLSITALCTVCVGNQAKPVVTTATEEHVKKYSLVGPLYSIKWSIKLPYRTGEGRKMSSPRGECDIPQTHMTFILVFKGILFVLVCLQRGS